MLPLFSPNCYNWRRTYKRQKIELYLTLFGIVAIIFILYQLTYYQSLNDTIANQREFYKQKARENVRQLLGVHANHAHLYHKYDWFQCLTSKENITFDKVNDDYCDCKDGSDEPGTSACVFTKFNCAARWVVYAEVMIPSGWVNDGVCDCCDGSDEWRINRNFPIINVKLRKYQRKGSRYFAPCPNLCPDKTL